MSLGLEVYKAFKQHVTGNHKPLQYNTEAADAIATFIADSVAVGSNNAVAKDLRSYFSAVPRQPVDTGDLYDCALLDIQNVKVLTVHLSKEVM